MPQSIPCLLKHIKQMIINKEMIMEMSRCVEVSVKLPCQCQSLRSPWERTGALSLQLPNNTQNYTELDSDKIHVAKFTQGMEIKKNKKVKQVQ